ncbi:MAG: D-alanyl-D-alanine carboxypeptidase, partial [Alphaproteobacteria bacterium]|nr:D-alanyl-D-alanine carboxypeptidase [Alphaproteobacteria bacterium]
MKLGLCVAVALSLFGIQAAQAQTAPALDVNARQAIIVEAQTGTVLFSKDAETPMPTSSMSKMMTMYLVFDAIKTGKLKLDDTLPVSEKAWKQEGSRMFLNTGDNVKVEDLIRGVIVQSGNDAAVVLAEGLASGSESAFADMMNAKAKALGMKGSHFANSTGLPDENHYSTAHDLAILAIAIQRDFPEHYHYFSELSYTYNGIAQGNRNPLLYRNMNVDGLKTGHTEVGGFGLTASAIREGRRLVLVLNGMKDMQARADESAKALDYGYREFGLYPIVKEGDILANPSVWLGTEQSVQIVAEKSAFVSLPRAARNGLKAVVSFEQPIPAP